MSAFRSIEQHKPMIRAANTGFSALVDPTGAIRLKNGLFSEAVIEGVVTASGLPLTWYARFGDWFAVFSLAGSLAYILYGFWSTRRRRR